MAHQTTARRARTLRRKTNKTISPYAPLPDGQYVWNKLPQEVKDIIFELAYVPDDHCTPMHKSSWQPRVCSCDHRSSAGMYGYCAYRSHECSKGSRLEASGDVVRRHVLPTHLLQTSWNPKVPMEDLMVDREWYRAASKVFYSCTNFVLRHNTEYDDDEHFAIQHMIGQQMEQSIIDSNGRPRPYGKLITAITFELFWSPESSAIMMKVVRMCPALKHVHLRMGDLYFDDGTTLRGEFDVDANLLTEDELKHFDPDLFQLRGMSSLTLNCPERRMRTTETFLENLRVLEHMLRSTASQPRPAHWDAMTADDENHDSTSQSSTQASDKASSGSRKVAQDRPWDKLPQELKEDILTMAYVPHRQVAPLHKTTWDLQEEVRRRWQKKDYEARWFPAKLVERFLVNREWYETASSAYYQNAEFYFKNVYKMLDFVAKDGKAYKYTKCIRNATVYLDMDSCDPILAAAIALCSSLRVLKLEIWGDFFDEADEINVTNPTIPLIWYTKWSEGDFRHFEATGSLLRLRQFPNVQITAIPSMGDKLHDKTYSETLLF